MPLHHVGVVRVLQSRRQVMQETSFGIPINGTVTVNADLTGKQKRYIQVRMEQLKEDMEKAHDEHDKKWYNRCIQELDWVLQMREKPNHNCYMEK